MDKNLRGVPKDLPGLNRVNGPRANVPFFEVLVPFWVAFFKFVLSSLQFYFIIFSSVCSRLIKMAGFWSAVGCKKWDGRVHLGSNFNCCATLAKSLGVPRVLDPLSPSPSLEVTPAESLLHHLSYGSGSPWSMISPCKLFWVTYLSRP